MSELELSKTKGSETSAQRLTVLAGDENSSGVVGNLSTDPERDPGLWR